MHSPDDTWSQLDGELILREAVGRLPVKKRDPFKQAMGTSTKLWPTLGRHVLEVAREHYEKAKGKGGTR